MPPVFEAFQVFVWIPHPVGQGLAAEGFVRPKMEVFLNTEFLCDFGNSVERGYGVVLPAFARGKDIGAQNSTPHPSPLLGRGGEGVALREFPQRYQAHRLGVPFYARHVLGADVNGFVENRDGFEFTSG